MSEQITTCDADADTGGWTPHNSAVRVSWVAGDPRHPIRLSSGALYSGDYIATPDHIANGGDSAASCVE